MKTVQISRILAGTRAEGPGKRVAIWSQGCSIRCSGCFNPHLWEPDPSKNRFTSDVISQIETLIDDDPEIEGISFLGGEPFNQAEPFGEIAEYFQKRSMSIMTFSGFTYDALQLQSKSKSGIEKLLNQTDLLVDGPFIQEKLDLSRPWLGSTNQRYLFLTNRYSMLDIVISQDKLEITIQEDGELFINGWASVMNIEKLTDLILAVD